MVRSKGWRVNPSKSRPVAEGEPGDCFLLGSTLACPLYELQLHFRKKPMLRWIPLRRSSITIFALEMTRSFSEYNGNVP